MFLHKLGIVANFCQKQGIVRDVLRSQLQPTPLPPSISIIARQFGSRFSEGEDDDYLPRDFVRRRQAPRGFQPNQDREFGFDKRQEFRQKFGNNNNNRFSSNRFSRPADSFFAEKRNPNSAAFGSLPNPNWDLASLEPIQKNFYEPHEKTLNRSDEEIAKFHAEHEITVPLGTPKPILEFDELSNVPKTLLKAIEKNNFEKASPIQAQAWPIALSGKNMVGIAQTG